MLRPLLILLPFLALSPTPASGQAPPLSLREVYELARERNPMLNAARAAAEAVATQEPASSLPPDPEIQIGVMNASLPGLQMDMPGSMLPSVQAMQMIPFPGKLRLGGQVARQSTAIARARADETWWDIRAEAAMAFYGIYRADRQIEVMGETLDWLRQFEQVATSMYSVGMGRQSDVLRAGVEVARMRADLTRMRAMRTTAVARLNALLDRPAAAPVPSVPFAALPADLPTAAELQSWAEESRPLLEGARMGVEQARTQQSLARRELWPDLTVGVQYGQRLSDMGTERMGSLMVGFSVPVFAGQRQVQMRNEAAAMERMADAELSGTRARVHAGIVELLAELERARTLVTLYRTEVLPQAEANVTSAFSSYRVGRVDFMTLLDAQMTLNQYSQELYELLAEYGQLLAGLEMAIGRELPATDTTVGEDA
jgi:outer membrane protein, heavy metal efflux system